MCFSNTSGSSCSGTWQTYSSSRTGWTLSGTADGTKTVYAWYKDSLGNISSTVSDSIVYTAPPVVAVPTITAVTSAYPNPATSLYAPGTWVYINCNSDATITSFTAHDDSSQFGTHADDYGTLITYSSIYKLIKIQMASASSSKCPLGYCKYTITTSCSNSGGTSNNVFYYYLETT